MATEGRANIGGQWYQFYCPPNRRQLDFLIRKNLGLLRLVQSEVDLTKAQVAEADAAMNQVLAIMLPSAPIEAIKGMGYLPRLGIFTQAMHWLGGVK